MIYHEINLSDFLKHYQGKKILYCPNPGNAGDALIAHSTYLLFDSNKLNVTIIKWKDTVKNQIVFYGGGGNLRQVPLLKNKEPASIRFLKRNIHQNKEVIILPHSINAYPEFFKSAPDHLKVICREKISHQFVHDNFPFKNNLFLSKDIAFYLNYKTYKRMGTGLLNCFRTDSEKTEIDIPVDNVDLSRKWKSWTWHRRRKTKNVAERFIREISKYEQVNTNRLHIAIAGALLGIKVNMYPNSYYKNKAVYEHAMREHYPNVTFINRKNEVGNL